MISLNIENRILLMTILMNLTPLSSDEIRVVELAGNYETFLKMIKHPGREDFDQMTVCMRWNSDIFHLKGVGVGREIILATIMTGEGNGNKDEYYSLGMGTMEDGSKDSEGREMGSYFMTSKGH